MKGIEMAEVKKGKRGKKICPGCNTELGVRTGTCPNCGFDFSSLKKEKEVKSGTGTGTEIKIKTEVETGETEENEEIQEEQQPVKETAYSREMRELLIHMMAHPVNNIDKLTPREHAERILAQGKESALSKNSLRTMELNGVMWIGSMWLKI